MKRLVLDASVAAKWFLPRAGEPLVDEAFELLRRWTRGEIDFVAPDLLWPEFANVAWKAEKRGRWTGIAAAQAVREMRKLGLSTEPSGDLIVDALSIALASGRSVYDSVYIALAVREGIEMITGDLRLAQAVAHIFPVRWLGAAE